MNGLECLDNSLSLELFSIKKIERTVSFKSKISDSCLLWYGHFPGPVETGCFAVAANEIVGISFRSSLIGVAIQHIISPTQDLSIFNFGRSVFAKNLKFSGFLTFFFVQQRSTPAWRSSKSDGLLSTSHFDRIFHKEFSISELTNKNVSHIIFRYRNSSFGQIPDYFQQTTYK